MTQPLRVLIVEDNPLDAELVVRELRRSGFEPEWKRVDTEAEFIAEAQPGLDIILSDYEMPSFSGQRALELLKTQAVDIPFIIISGTIGEDVAVEVMKQGATDYLLKDRLARLGVAVTHALEQGKLRREKSLAAEAMLQSERELRWKTAFLEAQVDAAIDGILVVDEFGHKMLQNLRMVELFQIPLAFANKKDDSDQLKWVTSVVADPDAFIERVNYLYAHPEEAGRDEVELKDGTVLDRYSAAVRGPDGRYYGRIWTFRDITERKRHAATLLESKRFLQSALNALTSHIAILDEQGTIIEVNAAWNRFAEENKFRGAHRGVGDNYLQLCDASAGPFSEEASKVAAGIRSVMAGQESEFQLEYPCHSPQERRWFVVRVTRFDGDGPLRVVVAHENITERKMAEQSLRESEQILREQASLLDKARDAILVRDLEHRVTYWNKGAERLYGWTAQELMGRKAYEVLYRDVGPFWEATAAVLKEGEWHGELQQIDKAGGVILIEGRWTLVRDGAGQPESILAINTDITEKKKIEQQFLRAQRVENIGALAGGIAHDLNNVLAPIMMSIDILKMTNREPRAQNILANIESSARRGADMVQQILSFARGVEGQRVMIDPRQVILDMQHLVQDTFPKNIRFQTELSADLFTFLGDHTQVHQVLLNLCVNARDAMPDGGTLTVGAQSFTVDTHYAAMHPDAKPGPYVMINVTDTGTGIPQEVADKIFDPFFTTKEQGKGTGLGLSTVLAIVKSHLGFLKLESESGKGTTFTVCFPAQDGSAGIVSVDAQEMMPHGQGELILIVDDEAAVRTITQLTLEANGYGVLVAADGAEAVAIFAQHAGEVAAVLTDMMMPVMDGPATIQVLKLMNPGVKIIAASGLSANGEVARAKGMGVEHFLAKPYSAQTILKTLRQVLTHNESESSLMLNRQDRL